MSSVLRVYVAAPFAASTQAERMWNTQRAEFLGDLARAVGRIPEVAHTSILAGHWGDDSTFESRVKGMEATSALCREVCKGGGVVWGLVRDDGTYSTGVQREINEAMRSGAELPVALRWSAWGDVVRVMWPKGRERWWSLRTFVQPEEAAHA